ncbi:MAG: 4-(cytidine 5'-diphospho)-2-C-methyl-D-erythritol kinase [Solirubrobacterales bacterium]
MTEMRAPAKLNLCLYLGGVREDGKHELASIFQPLELADLIAVEPLPAGSGDDVVCEGVEGDNLAAVALRELRAAGWEAPPLRITIEKRIPVAAGLGGGSADAAAVLRLALGEVEGLEEIAARIGADVPSQLDPATVLVGGAGESVESLALGSDYAIVLVPDERGLSTADVYAEADRLGLQRDRSELEGLRESLRADFEKGTGAAVGSGHAGVGLLDHTGRLTNDLQPAALSLMPEIAEALDALLEAGAAHAMVTGSGPTAVGLFGDRDAAERAAEGLGRRYSGTLVTAPDRSS